MDMARRASARAFELWSGNLMTQVLAGTTALFRDRDFFIHDGTKLRRFRISAPVQAVLLIVVLGLVAWASFATAQLAMRQHGGLTAATEARARVLEQRQALIEAALTGQKIDPSMVQAVTSSGRVARNQVLAHLEQQQLEQAALVARALDVRYQVTAAELHKLGIKPAAAGQPAGVGGPFESIANPTFKALFNSWKKLDELQNDVIAIPSDKPIRTAVTFTSGFGVRDDPFHRGAAMHPGIDLAGAYGTPIYATADGTVVRAGWNSGGYGNMVELDHGRGITTRYGHMSAVLVHEGDHVTRGEQIGRMGSTGRSTGNHLHYEVRIDGRPVNPIPFMKSTDYVLAMQKRSGSPSMDAVGVGGPDGQH
jgi:murein DD-endopeptidase MepM/ murein hydrolase activator NlpD